MHLQTVSHIPCISFSALISARRFIIFTFPVGEIFIIWKTTEVKNLPVGGVLTNMCVEINSAASPVKISMEFRPNSRSWRDKYNY